MLHHIDDVEIIGSDGDSRYKFSSGLFDWTLRASGGPVHCHHIVLLLIRFDAGLTCFWVVKALFAAIGGLLIVRGFWSVLATYASGASPC